MVTSPSVLERVPAVLLFGKCLSPEIQLPFIIVVVCLYLSNSWLFSCAQDRGMCSGTSATFLPAAGLCQREGPSVTLSLSPTIFVLSFYPSLCRRNSLRPQSYFRMNCWACRCRLSVCMGGGRLRLFLCHHFVLASFSFTF